MNKDTICDFCGGPCEVEALWQTTSPVTGLYVFTSRKDGSSRRKRLEFGTTWGACEACDADIKTGGVEAMLERLSAEGGWTETMLEDMEALWRGALERGFHPVTPYGAIAGIATKDDALTVFNANVTSARVLRDEIQAMSVDPDRPFSSLPENLRSVVAGKLRAIAGYYQNARRINKKWDLEAVSEEQLEWLRGLSHDAGFITEHERSANRRERMAARAPMTSVVMEGTRCTNGDGRPARIDGYCKRCAHELGILPKGKI